MIDMPMELTANRIIGWNLLKRLDLIKDVSLEKK